MKPASAAAAAGAAGADKKSPKRKRGAASPDATTASSKRIAQKKEGQEPLPQDADVTRDTDVGLDSDDCPESEGSSESSDRPVPENDGSPAAADSDDCPDSGSEAGGHKATAQAKPDERVPLGSPDSDEEFSDSAASEAGQDAAEELPPAASPEEQDSEAEFEPCHEATCKEAARGAEEKRPAPPVERAPEPSADKAGSADGDYRDGELAPNPDAELLKDHPLFGRIWTYHEMERHHALEKAEQAQQQLRQSVIARQKGLPEGYELEDGVWMPWLPDGWIQACKLMEHGVKRKVFISPEGKIFYHKARIELVLGYKMEPRYSPKTRDIKDPLCVPSWSDFLPKDWRIVYRLMTSKESSKSKASRKDPRIKCFVPPGCKTGFLYNREHVEEYLAGNPSRQLVPFWSSYVKGESNEVLKKIKMKHGKPVARVTADDYVDEKKLVVLWLPPLGSDTEDVMNCLKFAKLPPDDYIRSTADIVGTSELLSKRGFADDAEMVFVFKFEGRAEQPKQLFDWISGVYIRQSEDFNERACYQLVEARTGAYSGLACRPVYIFWCQLKDCWKIASRPHESSGAYARLAEDVDRPYNATGPWQVVKMSVLSLD
eukprot:TRINITY_DN14829_c0_g1_i3.p1 TRINITY_DN14829_c0_g1~~TRINITY_DN14829_c0_g1_i3.p1  ORF type:complete len:602 (-),score=151.60 TRINITY_DN14829_c0_g1_i3:142-1947(-)